MAKTRAEKLAEIAAGIKKAGETFSQMQERIAKEGITYKGKEVLAATEPPEKKGDETKVIRYGDEYREEKKEYFEKLDITPVTETEEADIRKRIAEQMQAQIDAINKMYETLITREEEVGVERLGRGRAMAARGGILGSPMWQLGQREKILGFTEENIKLLNEERELKKGAILFKIDERAEKEIALKKIETKENIEKYFAYLKEVRDDARADAKGLAESGVALAVLKTNKDIYDQLLEETGYSDFVFDAIYNNTLDLTGRIEYQYVWKGNTLVAMGVDPRTGKIKTETYKAEDLGIPTGINPGFITNEITGEMYFYDKDSPQLDAEGNLVLKSLGLMKKPKGEEEWKPNITEKGKLEKQGIDWTTPEGRKEALEFLYPSGFFTPTAAEKSKALGWLSKQTDVTEEDKKRLETDSTFFYWVLEQVSFIGY